MENKIKVLDEDCIIVGNSKDRCAGLAIRYGKLGTPSLVNDFPFGNKSKRPLDVPSPEMKFDLDNIDYCIDENGNAISSEEAEEMIWEFSEY